MKGDLDGLSRQISFVSLGCDKNTVDSEIMISLLAERGYALTKDDEKADVIIVNTCGFIQDAKEESIQHIKGTRILNAFQKNHCTANDQNGI